MDDTVYLPKCFSTPSFIRFSRLCNNGWKKFTLHFELSEFRWCGCINMEQREKIQPKAKRIHKSKWNESIDRKKEVEITVTISPSIQFTPTKHFCRRNTVQHKNAGTFISICSMNTEQCVPSNSKCPQILCTF